MELQQVEKGEEKYQSLVNNIGLGIFRSTPGPRGKFLEVNPALERITGYSREELLSMEVADLYLNPAEREAVLEQFISATGVLTKELCFKRKDGAEITVEVTKVPVRDSSGKVVYLDGILEDITERKKMQERLARTEKLTAIGTMAAGIAHEVLNPMMGILNFTQYCLKKTAVDDPRFPVLQDIEREAKRCVSIIQSLTTFSHIKKRNEEEYQKGSLAAIIEQTAKMLSYRIEKEDVRLTWQVAEDVPEIWMRADGIQQVLLNLLSNALDAVAGRGKRQVHIEAHLREHFVEMTITDSGRGIPPVNLPRVFDPFFTTKLVGQGTGMGLTVSRNIILEHGGDITCRSQPGVGTIFSILLPLDTKGGLDEHTNTGH